MRDVCDMRSPARVDVGIPALSKGGPTSLAVTVSTHVSIEAETDRRSPIMRISRRPSAVSRPTARRPTPWSVLLRGVRVFLRLSGSFLVRILWPQCSFLAAWPTDYERRNSAGHPSKSFKHGTRLSISIWGLGGNTTLALRWTTRQLRALSALLAAPVWGIRTEECTCRFVARGRAGRGTDCRRVGTRSRFHTCQIRPQEGF